ncbi:Nodulin-like domain-containing protein [Heracleum sosnowskyi]|uniref:Nodulin-like domain-containing protein n=1 Tax=Heracleum sosnowskyi TaxID=360622 RepID=A0AAD8IJF0_9APIA|nr:Nodulin-like domain-containing protein [Heracleum sosnowskyi]
MDLDICGTNGETYFKTGSVVTCIQNFPEHRGPIVGILKGFAGLNGANYEFMTQVYININLPNEAALIFVFALWSSMVITALMFILKPVGGQRQVRPSYNSSLFVYGISLVLAAYLLGVLLLQDIVNLNQKFHLVMPIGLIFIILHPIAIPILLVFTSKPISSAEESLLPSPGIQPSIRSGQSYGQTIIDNLGQMSQYLGYENNHAFVSMISIWNFLGRVAGCYFSEIVRRKYAYSRTVAMAVVQVLMPIALCSYTMVFPEQLLMGVGYGSHWAIAPAAASDLSGLKSFGALYNFLTLSILSGTLILSDVISAGKYDSEAEKQASISTVAKSRTNAQNAASLIVVCRTKKVYAELYGNSRQ